MTVVIEMVSDIVCPWCWLGLRRIEEARALAPEVEVQLLFRPYELDPTIPPEGVDYKAYMSGRVSSPEGKERMAAAVVSEAPKSARKAGGQKTAMKRMARHGTGLRCAGNDHPRPRSR